ncbi:MAG TPA: response regulator [Verrucomicrobiae bacterium]
MLPLLIVDDAREDALLVQRVLSQCKILNPVLVLNSGDACLDFFEAVGPFTERKLPCLVLLDMIMAPLSGLDVLGKLRSHGWLAKGSMVVMLSGLTDIKAIHEGYQLGAKTFLIKPLQAEDVMQMLNSIASLSAVKRPDGYELVFTHSSTILPPNVAPNTLSAIRSFSK